MRIVRLANFYGPRSGGLRTALHHLGAGYRERGHEVILVVPGESRREDLLPTGVQRITVPAHRIPATGGYRAADPRRVADIVVGLAPDLLEVSDRLTLLCELITMLCELITMLCELITVLCELITVLCELITVPSRGAGAASAG